MQKQLRYLWLHTNYDGPEMIAWHARQAQHRRERGFDIELMMLQLDPGSKDVYYYPKLDRLWKRGDLRLMRLYESLAEKLQDRDVLVHFNGAHLHPKFLEQLNIFKVYHCADDPESTDILSRPVAAYYDLHMISNIAAVEMYKSWGLPNVYFWPLGSLVDEDQIFEMSLDALAPGDRTIPIVFFGAFGGVYNIRAKRLAALSNAFPQAYCAGSGWPRGFVTKAEMWSLYRTAQIGWNIHNSTGPINFRVYDLPAFGVMQICDNKSQLGKVFELGTEVAGFETIAECIELTGYYLAHPEERRLVAEAGWRRWKRDYTPDRVWDTLVEAVEKHYQPRPPSSDAVVIRSSLRDHQARTRFRRVVEEIAEIPYSVLRRLTRSVRRRAMPIVRRRLLAR